MRHDEFKPGLEFWMSGKKWRVTDIGERTIIAINISEYADQSWYNGPPYAVREWPLDENDLPACSLERESGE